MKAIMKHATTDNYDSEMFDFAQTVDFTELFEHVKNFANVNCAFCQPEIETRHGNVYISFMSEDITSHTGPFAAILQSCYFQSFNNGVFRDKKTNELSYWVNVNIQYRHKDGGSNGMDLALAWYSNSKGWIFRDAGNY